MAEEGGGRRGKGRQLGTGGGPRQGGCLWHGATTGGGQRGYGGVVVAGECGRRWGVGRSQVGWLADGLVGGPPRRVGIWAARSKSNGP